MGDTSVPRDMTGLSVVDVMHSPVVCIWPSTLLGEALGAMLHVGVRHLVVVDQEGRCHGLLSDRAVTAAWAADPSALDWRPAGTLLDAKPAIVDVAATVRQVARLMHADRVDAVVVVDNDGHPLGVLTGSDLVALIATDVRTDEDVPPEADPRGSPPKADQS